MTREQLAPYLHSVEGWLTLDEAVLLYQLASECPPGSNIVEIGSYRGRSTIALALGARQSGAAVYAIDPHDPYTVVGAEFGEADNSAFMQNLLNAGLADVVRVINYPSTAFADAWFQPIALLFIDGNHEGDAPAMDYTLYTPYVRQAHGKIAFHDSQGAYEQPTALVQQIVRLGQGHVWRIVDQMTVLELVSCRI